MDPEEGDALRPALAIPLIVLSVGWDVVTLPPQAIFAVWPWWGDNSLHMNVNNDE